MAHAKDQQSPGFVVGMDGPNGFVAYPGARCGLSVDAWVEYKRFEFAELRSFAERINKPAAEVADANRRTRDEQAERLRNEPPQPIRHVVQGDGFRDPVMVRDGVRYKYLKTGAAAGSLIGHDQQRRPPGTLFARSDILAVLEDRPHFAEAVRELDELVSIFERME